MENVFHIYQVLPWAQRIQGFSALTKLTAFKSYHKLIKIQFQNLDQTPASKIDQTPASKSRPHLSLSVFTKLQLQNDDQLQNLDENSARFGFAQKMQLLVSPLTNCVRIRTHQEVLNWHLQRPGSDQRSLLNSSESVCQLVSH